MSTSQEIQTKLDSQYRLLLILWTAFLGMFVIYYFLPAMLGWPQKPEVPVMRVVFNILSPLLVAVSFFVKRNFLARSVATHDVRLVNTGFIVTAALCEAGALMGLLDYLVAQDRYYFVLIGFALLALVLHFPRRAHLAAASFPSSGSSI